MRAKRNDYPEMRGGGMFRAFGDMGRNIASGASRNIQDQATGFAERRPGLARLLTRGAEAGAGRLLGGGRGMGLLGMGGFGLARRLGQILRERKQQPTQMSAQAVQGATDGATAVKNQDASVMDIAQGIQGSQVPGVTTEKEVMGMPTAEYGAGVKRYRAGGMIYAQDSDDVPLGRDPETVRELLSALENVKPGEEYSEQDIIDVRGAPKFYKGEEESTRKEGFSLEREDVAQPMAFRVRTKGRELPGTQYDFKIEGVELGGVNEETGDIVPNKIILPPHVYDLMESGEIDERDMTRMLAPYYARSGQQGVRTLPVFERGEESEPSGSGKGDPPRNRYRTGGGGGLEFSFGRAPRPQAPRFSKGSGQGSGLQPLFTRGQLGRMGRQT